MRTQSLKGGGARVVARSVGQGHGHWSVSLPKILAFRESSESMTFHFDVGICGLRVV